MYRYDVQFRLRMLEVGFSRYMVESLSDSAARDEGGYKCELFHPSMRAMSYLSG